MKIKVKMISVDCQLPDSFDVNGDAIFDLEEKAGFSLLCLKIGIQDKDQYIVLHNNFPVPPSDRNSLILNDGDQISIFPPLEGG